MKKRKRHFIECETVADVLLTIEKFGETGEVTRVFIGEVDVTELLEHVQDNPDFLDSLNSTAEFDEDAAYEYSRE